MPEIHPLLNRLIAERKSRGITQTAVAKHIGISRSAICELEQGLHEPKMRTFIGYAEALGFEVLPGLSADRSDIRGHAEAALRAVEAVHHAA